MCRTAKVCWQAEKSRKDDYLLVFTQSIMTAAMRTAPKACGILLLTIGQLGDFCAFRLGGNNKRK